MRRILAGLAFALVLLGIAGCGVRPSEAIPAGEAPRQKPRVQVTLYWIGEGRLVTYPRMTSTGADPAEAVRLLLGGPTSAEMDMGFSTALPAGAYDVTTAATGERLDLRLGVDVSAFNRQALDQIVCTAVAASGHGDIPVSVEGGGIRLDARWCRPNP